MFKYLSALVMCLSLSSCILPVSLINHGPPVQQTGASNSAGSSSTVSLQPGFNLDVFTLPSPRTLSHWNTSQLDTASGQGWSQLEQEIMLTTNMLRQNPAQFAEDFLQPIIQHVQSGKQVYLPGNIVMFNSEGLNGLQEAYNALKSTESKSLLQPSPGIRQAALQHVQDQGPRGETGHTGSDGSSPQTRLARFGQCGDYCGGENISYGEFPQGLWHVLSLVVDDNVPSRGHRTNLLKPEYRVMGVGCGSHSRYQAMCVQDFAGSYTD